MTSYRQDFYENRDESTRSSARIIIEVLFDYYTPESVIDYGCGVGFWLKEFELNGISDIYGIEGQWVDRSSILLKENQFQFSDLTKPLKHDNKYDLALSLEVAEHIPEKYCFASAGIGEKLFLLVPEL